MLKLISINNVYSSLEGFAIKNNILLRRFATNPDRWSRLISEDLSSFKEMGDIVEDPWAFMRGTFLFHDQEPLLYLSQKPAWRKFMFTRKVFDDRVILLHSEKNSREVDEFCKDYNAIPVHWFSNGALAYEWYSVDRFCLFPAEDFKLVQMQYRFSCLNRLIGQQRVYRPILSSMLESTIDNKELRLSCNLVDPHSNKHISECLDNIVLPKHHLALLKKFENRIDPVLINVPEDDERDTGDSSSSLARDHYFMFTFCHIATETMFYDDTLHLTEKSLRAFVNMRPMILVGPPGALAYLRSYGFRTFGDYWDESYDNEKNPHKRLDKIFELIKNLNKMSLKDMTMMLRKMEDILAYNRNHFFNKFPNIILEELMENTSAAFLEYAARKPNGWLLERITSLTNKEFAEIKNSDFVPDDISPAKIYEDLRSGDRSSQDSNVRRFLHQHLGLDDVSSASEALNKIYQILA